MPTPCNKPHHNVFFDPSEVTSSNLVPELTGPFIRCDRTSITSFINVTTKLMTRVAHIPNTIVLTPPKSVRLSFGSYPSAPWEKLTQTEPSQGTPRQASKIPPHD